MEIAASTHRPPDGVQPPPSVILRRLGLELRRWPHAEPGRPQTLTRHHVQRLLYFHGLLQQVEGVAGDIVECGVGAGQSLFMLGVLSQRSARRRSIWGFDSFEGLPAPGPEDDAGRMPDVIAAGRLATREEEVRARLVRSGLSERHLEERLRLVKGFFPSTFAEYSGEPIALLHLDVDLYQSYKDCLERFEPLVSPGGVIAFDEYRSTTWVGATQAIEEYFGGPPPGIQKDVKLNCWFLVKRPPGFSPA